LSRRRDKFVRTFAGYRTVYWKQNIRGVWNGKRTSENTRFVKSRVIKCRRWTRACYTIFSFDTENAHGRKSTLCLLNKLKYNKYARAFHVYWQHILYRYFSIFLWEYSHSAVIYRRIPFGNRSSPPLLLLLFPTVIFVSRPKFIRQLNGPLLARRSVRVFRSVVVRSRADKTSFRRTENVARTTRRQ